VEVTAMKTVSAALTVLFLGESLMLAPTGWAQTSAPPASPSAPKATDQPSSPSGSVTTPPSGSGTSTAPASPGTSTPAPAQPGSPGGPATSPGTGTATDPARPRGDATVADDGTIFGMSRTAAIILGLVILGIIVALVSMSRRDRDVIETRTDRDVRVYDRERDVLDDRDRPRKVS
jgi:hypothetical protein